MQWGAVVARYVTFDQEIVGSNPTQYLFYNICIDLQLY